MSVHSHSKLPNHSPGLVGLSHSAGSLAGVAGALCAELGLGAGLELELDERSRPSAEFVRNVFDDVPNMGKLSCISLLALPSSLLFDRSSVLNWRLLCVEPLSMLMASLSFCSRLLSLFATLLATL